MPHIDDHPTPYDDIADLYDLEHDNHHDDIALVRNIVAVVGDPVIEFGCGSGRLLLPIAQDGYSITGVDSSRTMLDRAHYAVTQANLSKEVSLVYGHMEARLDLEPRSFGVGIFSLNGLMHLTSQEAQLTALTEACRLLDPRGQLVIDLFNPTPEYLTFLDSRTLLEGVLTSRDGGEVEKWAHRKLRPSQQLIETRIWYDSVSKDGQVHRRRSSFALRYIHAAELALMVQQAGFAEWQLYGTYDLDPYDDASDRIIMLADRGPS